jgi:demethylmenaquinone methyltransferase/2-methoxy-6-polyprenyl-1,4-benzoquinol methylase
MGSPRPLQRMFEAVPPRYDLVNRLITLGMDRRWRSKAVEACRAGEPRKILDVCCGTADLVLELAATLNGPAVVAGLDYSTPMLEAAVHKLARTNTQTPVSLVQGDASRLPFKDGSLDCVGIAFGFRNMTYKNPLAEAHLRDVHRVLADGGRYVIVESSQPGAKIVNRLFKLYCRTAVYRLGAAVSGNKGAYRYLAESAANYYAPQEVAEMLRRAGFRKVDYRPLFFGAAGIHIAHK